MRLHLERTKVFEKANKIEKLDQAVRGSEKVVLGSREQVVCCWQNGEKEEEEWVLCTGCLTWADHQDHGSVPACPA